MAYFLDERLHALTLAENTREKTYGEAPARKRTNNFPGVCVRCNGRVPKGAGILTKRGSKWEVAHETCP